MPARISFIRRILDFVMPRICAVCGEQLNITDHAICMKCNMHMPRTDFCKSPYDNAMAQQFWGLIPIEKAAALFYYYPHTYYTNIILDFKYEGMWNIAEDMGRVAAVEFKDYGFFDDIDVIVPVPITWKRKLKRGYNQCYHIAIGIKEITGLPINLKAVERRVFKESQTQMTHYERRENVKDVFQLKDPSGIRGKHVLVIDDVVTTGSTIIACCEQLLKGGARTFSVLSIGFTRG